MRRNALAKGECDLSENQTAVDHQGLADDIAPMRSPRSAAPRRPRRCAISSPRGYVFRFAPADIAHCSRHVCFVPISEVNDSFDHVVGERQQCRGDGNAERFRGFEIDHERKLARLLDREIAGPGANKDFAT
jgi:hypothetical protein